jgi:uncharacterized membrane protein YeaQ/YmgE (transglycosylase-associated protein family)
MTTALWVVAGGLLGWISYSFLVSMRGGGMILSIGVGITGAIVGGRIVAPMFIEATAIPGAFSLGALLVAAAAAAAFLAVSALIHSRSES